MAIVVQGRQINIPDGKRALLAEAIPDGLMVGIVVLKRSTSLTPSWWSNPLTWLKADAYLSLDDGVTWLHRGGITSVGGVGFEGAAEVPELTWWFQLLPGTNRRIRVEVEVQNGPLNSELDVMVI
jgi:hypothetical protein